MSQSLTGAQQKDVQFPLEGQGMQFWLEKVVAWGQSDSAEARRDTCRHFSRLRDFLQEILTHISKTSSTKETMKKLPLLGQFLGRLCWNPFITADDACRGLIFQCLWGLYSEHPSNSVERKANQWIRKVLCQLATEDNNTTDEMLMKYMNVAPADYHLKLLRKMVAMLQDRVGERCNLLGDVNQRCSCDSVLAVSEACVPLATYAEAAPLIGALLQRPSTCAKATLSEHFLDELSSAYSRHSLLLEDQAIISLWYHSLPCLENAVFTLLESVLTYKASTSQELEQQVAKSLLPKACAQHCSMFFIVNDIFRNLLQKQEENESVRSLIQTFTSCFYRELKLLQPQASVSLRAFFPQTPHSLLVPLLTPPSEMPREAWRHHLNWLSGSLQRLTEEEEEEDGDRSSGRGHHRVFEAWFLLVQCGHWVQAAAEMMVTTEPEHGGALLWLLTFYHHPTNRGHHRDLQLVRAKEASEHLCLHFSAGVQPLPVDGVQELVALLSPPTRQPSLSPLLILDLLVNSAVFSQQSASRSAETLQKVVEASGLLSKAARALASLELRLNRQTDRVHLRMGVLRNALTRTNAHAPQSPR